MRVVGTAGHVDHGKSTLIRALTGIDPDRLAEEKKREMTIDLGFAWMSLPNNEKVGFVDVPGHQDFIENMLAGVGGIDAVLLVIAADEGVMPQTQEHVAILDLLGIGHGLVALTKIDAVDDPDWLELVEQDVAQVLAGTVLQEAEVIRVSSRTGVGTGELVEKLVALLKTVPARTGSRYPRLPIDRIFSISGFGTVVTGTLISGHLRTGEEVEIQPSGLRGRIRGLQSYLEETQIAEPGNRLAVNLSGIDRHVLKRGDVLTLPGQMKPTQLIDARFRYLNEIGRTLKHNAEIKFYSGAAHTSGYVRLLADDELQPGTESWIQLRLTEPMALEQGDRFILRYSSPSRTIGGGQIIDPAPPERWKRFQAAVIQRLQTRMRGTPLELIVQAASLAEPVKLLALQKSVNLNEFELNQTLNEALDKHLLIQFPGGLYQSAKTFEYIVSQMVDNLHAYHQAHPLRLGMGREELRSRVTLTANAFSVILNAQQEIVVENNLVRLSNHSIQFTPAQKSLVDELKSKMSASPYTPPSFSEAAQVVGEDLLYALIDLGEIVQVQPDIILSIGIYQEMIQVVFTIIDEKGSVAVNELRDYFGTTRKYAIALLEHLDSTGLTRRTGDVRVRGVRSLQG
jgi:selenocysteine-specific elongation factor